MTTMTSSSLQQSKSLSSSLLNNNNNMIIRQRRQRRRQIIICIVLLLLVLVFAVVVAVLLVPNTTTNRAKHNNNEDDSHSNYSAAVLDVGGGGGGGGSSSDNSEIDQNHNNHDSDGDDVLSGTKQQQQQHGSSSSILLRKLSAASSSSSNNRVLNVHVVPHTHDDVGWLKTVSQYYYGWNNTIDLRGNVRSIITTVIEALLANSARTFTIVEMKYFTMWWYTQNDAIKDSVRYLVANNQLVFVNGGWCMHDEATTHYMGMIDQTTLGHDFLKHEFGGYVPTVGWQLDPFGHSSTQASLLTRTVGMNALYFGRIDYQDLQFRRLTKQCEGLWEPTTKAKAKAKTTTRSKANTRTATTTKANHNSSTTDIVDDDDDDKSIFWGLTGSYQGNYGPPNGFWYDILAPDNEPLVGMNETHLKQRIHTFLEDLRIQSDQTQGNHIMLTMGSDFHFMEAHYNFANYDLLIGSIMNYQKWNMLNIKSIFGPKYDRINIFYSHPEYYTECKYNETILARRRGRQREKEAVDANNNDTDESLAGATAEEDVRWNVKTDDFFPYSDGAHAFWSGYFTSRAAFKRFERVASSFLLAARQIESMLLPVADGNNKEMLTGCSGGWCRHRPLYPLEDSLGIVQHHDAVSGTAKQHVADDYSLRLQTGFDHAMNFVVAKLRTLMLRNDQTDLKDLTYCQVNETTCRVSEEATKPSSSSTLYAIVYNPLASELSSTIVRIPVSSDAAFKVDRVEEAENATTMQVVRSVPVSRLPHSDDTNNTKYLLMFDTGKVPPVGAVTFRIALIKEEANNMLLEGSVSDKTTAKSRYDRRAKVEEEEGLQDIDVSNGFLTARFDRSTGLLKRISRKGAVDLNVTQSWGYYTSFDSHFDTSYVSDSPQNSGAYIFRPSEPEQNIIPLHVAAGGATFKNTSVGMEVHVSFEQPWIKQVTRILTGQPYVEMEYSVGPVPIDDGRGKEIVTRYTSPIQSRSLFYTDSNGREFIERRRNYRPTWSLSTYESVAGNYYPVNAAIFVEDPKAAMSVVVDRSQGGASLRDGDVELMVQRRTLVDDGRGVDEPLNETTGGMTAYPPYGNATRKGNGVVVRGTHRITIGQNGGASLARSIMDGAFAEPLVFVGSAPSNQTVSFQQASFSALQTALPSSVMLVTFKKLANLGDNSTFLIRLGHQYGAGEDDKLSLPVEIDLMKLFKGYRVIKVTEKTLSNNQDWESYTKRRFRWKKHEDPSVRSKGASNTTFTLQPMDIRTFEIVMRSGSR